VLDQFPDLFDPGIWEIDTGGSETIGPVTPGDDILGGGSDDTLTDDFGVD
jgi:hypothetical protein